MKYTIDYKAIQEVSKHRGLADANPQISGIMIKDEGAHRLYVATNGMMLMEIKTERNGAILKNPLVLIPDDRALPQVAFYTKDPVELEPIGDDRWIVDTGNRIIAFREYKDQFVDYKKVYPKKGQKARFFVTFDPNLFSRIFPLVRNITPIMDGDQDAAMWEIVKENRNYTIVLMPMAKG